jgi:Bifunctional DNA primase/polymerase, N-terminal
MSLRTPDAYGRAACDYIAHGWPVFLLGRTKRPVANCRPCHNADSTHDPAACGCLTCHGFYAATLDHTRFDAMRNAIPDGLLAIRTGTASGLCVVDIDPRDGGAIDYTVMTPTATVATGGGGWHLLYQHPGEHVPSRRIRPGVDIKADGGYIVAAPSIHPSTRQPYRWVGGRPVSEIAPPLRAYINPAPPPTLPIATVATRITVNPRSGGAISSPSALLAAHLQAVAAAPEGRRRRTLYGAARGVARMVTAGAIDTADAITALANAGRAAGQSDRDTRNAITGGFRDEGITT